MRKYADRYLDQEAWSIAETGFHPDRSRVSESLFSQANEYMGLRAHFEEGYSGDTLPGAYLNGVYEEQRTQKSYKGISDRVCFMVNTIDWLELGLTLDGEQLDLATSRFRDFHRRLDFRTGLLSRSLIWTTAGGKDLALRFERFLSMPRPELCYQRLTVTPLNFSGSLSVSAGIHANLMHEMNSRNWWEASLHQELPRGAALLAVSQGLGHRIHATFALGGDALPEGRFVKTDTGVGRLVEWELRQGETRQLTKTSVIVATRHPQAGGEPATPGIAGSVSAAPSASSAPGFEAALAENRRYWDGVWELADIAIGGDPENQQGIRHGIFQLEQTFRGRIRGANIGAKGLSGEAYNGNAFWDTEVYCLPYYLFKTPAAARGLLDFRYDTLPQAMERAKALDCEGACFPVATIDGTESCTLWQHASLQFQPTSSVAYAIRHYLNATGDREWLLLRGAEMLIQVARFLVSRAQWSERKQAWGYYCVMGPDEFQMMVNHNAYTNFMGGRSLAWAAETLESIASAEAGDYRRIAAKTGLRAEELVKWQSVASGMYLPRESGSLLYEQHEGYFDLPHVDIKAIPPEEFPLYHSWSYDRIYRNDMIKQPDVLMFMLLYNRSFSAAEKRANYEFYEPRCIHESSLSPSVHSILAAELDKMAEATDFFRFATRIDLDNFNRNTREGLHLTAIAAAWMNIVYGFGGFRSDGESPAIDPRLPPGWSSLGFQLRFRGSLFKVLVEAAGTTLTLVEGPALTVELAGRPCRLETADLAVFTPHARAVATGGPS